MPRVTCHERLIYLGRRLVGLLCRLEKTPSPTYPTRYMHGGFDIVVDVRPAENYADGHITGAYNHPGLAFLPSTDDLMPNLGDCKAKKVAVPCALFELNPSCSPSPIFNRIAQSLVRLTITLTHTAPHTLPHTRTFADRSNAGLATWRAAPGATCVPGASSRSMSLVRTRGRHTRATPASLTGTPRDIRPLTFRSHGRRLSACDPSPSQ